MTYVLEDNDEIQRLEKQNAQAQYSIEKELDYLKLDLNGKKILDAGCGTGSLSSILSKKFKAEIHGCDSSLSRLEQARSLGSGVSYFQSDITNLKTPDHFYDTIFTRFVLEHTPHPGNMLRELKRVLKVGGEIIIIELDGLIFNLYHQSQELKNYLKLLEEKLPIDLFIGRKIPRMLHDYGLQISSCHVQPMVFSNQDLEVESQNMIMRFEQSKNISHK